ncbi:p19 [Dregea volubilis virus 1]|nr:p19 [Dregea volubilis virus 1]
MNLERFTATRYPSGTYRSLLCVGEGSDTELYELHIRPHENSQDSETTLLFLCDSLVIEEVRKNNELDQIFRPSHGIREELLLLRVAGIERAKTTPFSYPTIVTSKLTFLLPNKNIDVIFTVKPNNTSGLDGISKDFIWFKQTWNNGLLSGTLGHCLLELRNFSSLIIVSVEVVKRLL